GLASVAMGLDGAVDLVDERLTQPGRRDQRLALALGAAVAGEGVEQVGALLADLPIGGEEAEVLVEPRVLGVEVAGTDHHVVAHRATLAAHDQDQLGVGLEPWDAVY